MNETGKIGEKVHSFYQRLHFNEGADVPSDHQRLDPRTLVDAQLLPAFRKRLANLTPGSQVLDCGCGIGWLAISIAGVFKQLKIVGVDFSERALARAAELGRLARANVSFRQLDLLDSELVRTLPEFEAVVSIGALHHTGDFPTALQNCASRVARGGDLLLGLYHKRRRAPFLERFEQLRRQGATESELRQAYFILDKRSSDLVRRESWFLDQVEHPHETQHTLAEVRTLLGREFAPIENSLTGRVWPAAVSELEKLESEQEAAALSNLERGLYDPGFFLAHFRRS